MSALSVSIVGASGYVGGELLRLLVPRDDVEIKQVTSESNAGRPVRTQHPQLRGWCDLKFSRLEDLEPVDFLILALPHGEAAARIEDFSSLAERIIDCSADFRLQDAAAYERTYGRAHPCPEWLVEFQYGLPEAHRGAIQDARHVSGVGCNATASNLALLPLVRAGVLDEARPVVVDLKVGSSEAGRRVSPGSHHPERSGVVRSFAPTDHRHTAEVKQVTGLGDLHLSVTSVDIVRGAMATAHLWLKRPMTDRDLWGAYRESYGSDPFVRLVHDKGGAYRHPEPRLVTGTNHADVGWQLSADGQRLVSLCAIDNLMKGAAGSALQCLNLMAGLEESAGLRAIGIHPL